MIDTTQCLKMHNNLAKKKDYNEIPTANMYQVIWNWQKNKHFYNLFKKLINFTENINILIHEKFHKKHIFYSKRPHFKEVELRNSFVEYHKVLQTYLIKM